MRCRVGDIEGLLEVSWFMSYLNNQFFLDHRIRDFIICLYYIIGLNLFNLHLTLPDDIYSSTFMIACSIRIPSPVLPSPIPVLIPAVIVTRSCLCAHPFNLISISEQRPFRIIVCRTGAIKFMCPLIAIFCIYHRISHACILAYALSIVAYSESIRPPIAILITITFEAPVNVIR